jgi:Tol biopolymer transport system component
VLPFAFGTPEDLGAGVNSARFEGGPDLSADGLTLYFTSDRDGNSDLFVATRRTTADRFGAAESVGAAVNTPSFEAAPSISADGLSLYFESDRPGSREDDIWVATRPTPSRAFGAPANLGSLVNSAAVDAHPEISEDGLSLYFSSYRDGGRGGSDIWVSRRSSTDQPFGAPAPLTSVNSSGFDGEPSISADGRALFFASDRARTVGGTDLWVSMRSSRARSFGPPVNVGPRVNTVSDERTPDISDDGRSLYFSTTRPGIGYFDIWQSAVRKR